MPNRLTRRSFLQLGALGLLDLSGPAAGVAEWLDVAPSPLRHRFNIGTMDAIAVNDTDVTYKASQYFTNAPANVVSDVLAARSIDPEAIPSPFTCLYVASGRNRVLIDTGAGALLEGGGRLLQEIRSEGIRPEDIDTVILTHAHPDHIGGITNADGTLAFPNAEFVMDQMEWAFWTDESRLASVEPFFAMVARQQLAPIRDRIRLVTGETEIVPGIRTLTAAGHTPGHAVVVIESGGDRLLYLSDTVLHPLHLEYPSWQTSYDMDVVISDVTKRRISDMAAVDKMGVLAFHFHPFPGLGTIERKGSGWGWTWDQAHE